ncbi:Neutral metalloprotease precursor [compost metagenome]
MKQRKAWAALLGSATIGLSGCTGALSVLGDDAYLGLPTSQRPSKGDQLPNTLPPSEGGSGGSGSNGGSGSGSQAGSGATFGESGTNPTQVALASDSSLRVEALFPKSSQTSVSISNTNRGMLAMAGFADFSSSQPTLSVSWPSASSLLAANLPSSGSAEGVLTDEASFKRELRQRLRAPAPAGIRQTQAVRGLINSDPPSVWIDTATGMQERPIKVYPVETLTHNGRTTRFALAVDTSDEVAVFGGSLGDKLRSELIKSLRTNVIPSLQAVYGGIPSQSEAQAKDVQFQTDVTYFIFSSKLKTNLLGYFNPGDFFPGGSSNQIKALYLSASAAQSARNSTAQLNDLQGTIAHELQHLLFAWNRVKALGSLGYLAEAQQGADIWIDEGLAMLATANAGFGLEAKSGDPIPYVGPSQNLAGHVRLFLTRTGDYSMVAFHAGDKLKGESGDGNPAAAYGMAYLFAQYMVDQLGTEVVGNILSSTKNGLTVSSGGSYSGNHDPLGIVNDGLSRQNVKFGTLFANFAAAVALDGTDALASSDASMKQRFDIQRINLRKSPIPGITLSGPNTINKVTAPPRPFGIRVLNPGFLDNASTLQFSGNANVSTRLILHR